MRFRIATFVVCTAICQAPPLALAQTISGQITPAPDDQAAIPGRPSPGSAAPPLTQIGPFSFATTISVGTLFRLQQQNPALIGIANGGTAQTPNNDDGDRNFNRGVALAGARGDSLITYTNGAFEARAEGIYFGNYVNSTGAVFAPETDTIDRELKAGGYLRDTYLGYRVPTALGALTLRAGDQTLRWNETSFNFGAEISNPYISSRQFLPGAGPEDAIAAVPMLTARLESQGGASITGFYRLNFVNNESTPCGFFVSTSDILCPGRQKLVIGSNSPDNGTSVASTQAPFGSEVPYGGTKGGAAQGQFGVNIRSPDFGGAAKASVNLIAGRFTDPIGEVSATAGSLTDLLGRTSQNFLAGSRYFLQYPSGVGLLGGAARFNLTSTTQIRGEVNTRFGQPLQIDEATEIAGAETPAIVASRCLAAPNSAACAATIAAVNQFAYNKTINGPVTLANYQNLFGANVQGASRHDVTQFGFGVTQVLPPMFGASAFLVGGEFGALLVAGYNSNVLPLNSTVSPRAGTPDVFATTSSYGYRLLARLVYKNVLGLASISPTVAFLHDVRGVSPGQEELFLEGTLRLRVAVDVAFTDRITGSLQYLAHLNRNGLSDLSDDKDFLLASLSYRF